MKKNVIDLFKEKAEQYDNYVLFSVRENEKYALGFLGNPYDEDQDVPIIVLNKNNNSIDVSYMPIGFGETTEIWSYYEDKQYEQESIEKLLNKKHENKNNSNDENSFKNKLYNKNENYKKSF